MEESQQFKVYQEAVRAKNVNACNALLSRLARFHGEALVKVERVIVIEVPSEPEPPPPTVPEWITSIEDGPRKPTINEIKKCVCKHFGVSASDLDSPRRNAAIVLPRQIGYYLARKLTTRSYPEIGRRFGGRDHGTIHHSVQKITRMIAADAAFARTVEKLEAHFQ